MALSPTSSRGGGSLTPPVTLQPTDASSEILVLKGAVGQTGSPLKCEDSNGAVVAEIDEHGSIFAGGAAAAGSHEAIFASGNAGQSVDIVTVADSSSAPVGGFNKSGYWYTLLNAAPADAALSAGQAMLWLDATNGVGATKLMVKAKSADGTVKSAAIVLA